MLITILHSWLLICSSKALNLAISCLQCSSSARGPVSSASFRIWSLSANIYILFMNIIMKTLKQCTHDLTSERNTHIYSLRRKLNTVNSRYYVYPLLRYIGYYVGNSKHKTISYLNLYKMFPLLHCPKMSIPSIML